MSTSTAVDGAETTVEHKRATVRPDKAAAVAEIAEAFRGASAAVLTEYRGLTVKQIVALRTALGADTTYAVVKNTLTKDRCLRRRAGGRRRAALRPDRRRLHQRRAGRGRQGAARLRPGNPALVVKGGVMDGKALSADEVRKLADLESREVLLAKMAGAMLASLSQAVYLLNAPLAQAARLAGALQAKAEQDPSVLKGGAGTPAAAPERRTGPLPTTPLPQRPLPQRPLQTRPRPTTRLPRTPRRRTSRPRAPPTPSRQPRRRSPTPTPTRLPAAPAPTAAPTQHRQHPRVRPAPADPPHPAASRYPRTHRQEGPPPWRSSAPTSCSTRSRR
jgi:large subunit ribosomal protein L10